MNLLLEWFLSVPKAQILSLKCYIYAIASFSVFFMQDSIIMVVFNTVKIYKSLAEIQALQLATQSRITSMVYKLTSSNS